MCISKGKRKSCYDRDGHKCLKCGNDKSLTCDHVIPKSLGGKDWLKNLQTLCKKCNEKKGDKIKQYSNHKKTKIMVNRFMEEGVYWASGRVVDRAGL